MRKALYNRASEQTMKTLPKFLKELSEGNYDYSTVCYCLTAGMKAVFNALNDAPAMGGGITGFQASYIMWECMVHIFHQNDDVGLKLIDYSEMMYPQYAHKFEKTIDKKTWKALQKKAIKTLDESKLLHPEVRQHLENIKAGIIPFGYIIKKREE